MANAGVFAILLSLMVAAPGLAQDQSASVYGVVRDVSGIPAPGIRVEARDLSTGLVTTTVTSKSGYYRFAVLVPGRYDITADPTGARVTRFVGLQLSLGWTLSVELWLGRGDVAEPVASGQLSLPAMTESASFANIRDQRLENQPRGRDYTSVTLQAPGANYEYKLGGLSIDGASTPENRYFIDGVDTGRLDYGLPGKELVTDFVEEVQVKSSGYAAEYGGSTGAATNVITRSGSAWWRGEVMTYFASDRLGGNASARARPEGAAPPLDQGRPVLRLVPSNASAAETVRLADDEFNRFEPGFSLSGPVVGGRVWLFGGYLARLERTTRQVAFQSGSSASFERTDTTHFASLGVTARLANALQARTSVHLSPYHRRGALPSIRGTDNIAVDYAALGRDEPTVSASASVDWTPAGRTTLGVRAGYFRTDGVDLGVPDQVQHVFSRTNIGLAGVPEDYQRPNQFSDVPSNAAASWDIQRRLSVSVETSVAADFLGRHLFKAGVQFEELANDLLQGEQQPVVALAWNATYTATDGRRLRGPYGFYRVRQQQSAGDVTGRNLGLFIQDNWTIADRLTLNVGLRAEREQVPSYANGPGYARYAIEFGPSEKLAPRAGFAWDVRGDGRWKAYGSWGLFYDTIKLELPRSLFGGFRWVDYRFTLDTYDWPSIGGNGCPPACPGTFIEALNFAPPSNDPAHNLIDTDLRPMRSSELTLGLQRVLGRTGSTGVRYVRKRLDRTVEDVGVLVPGQGYSYFIANPGFGLAEYTLGTGYPPQPPARRDYDGIEVEASTRVLGVLVHGSYLFSRLYGNYSGLASSDDVVVAPNVTGAFDLLQQSFDENARPVFGPLATDRPHQFKLQATYTAPFGTTLSLNVYALSGAPVTRRVTMQNAIVFYRGRGSDGRTDALTQTDLYVQHDIRLGGAHRVRLSLNVLNLFDQAAVTGRYSSEYAGNIPISTEDFFRGFDVAALAAQSGIPPDPRFLMPQTYQPAREIWVAAKLVF